MHVELLGRFGITMAGQAVELGTRKQRLLLAVLIVADGAALGADAVTDALWNGKPPSSAAANLRQYVYRLRAALGNDRIVRRGRTHLQLRMDDIALDSRRFTELATAADLALQRSQPEIARRHLVEALALWRGNPFGELDGEPALSPRTTALTEQYLAVMQQRIDLDLASGRHAETVADLTGLVAAHPYQERFYSRQMLALYRSGRAADALRVFGDARETLNRDLGIDPGPDLRRLQQAILRQDGSLMPSS